MKKTVLRIALSAAAAALVCIGLAVSCADDGVEGKNPEVGSYLDMFAGWGKQAKLTVNIRPNDGGEVSLNPKSENNTYKPKSAVTAMASEFEEYRFLGWSGDLNDSSSSVTVTMNKDVTINANFLSRNIPAFPLLIGINPEGSGGVSRLPSQTVYKAGDTVAVTAVALAGYRFIGWSGTVNDTAVTVKIITVDGGFGPTANFIPLSAPAFSLDARAEPAAGGAVARNPNWVVYQQGDLVLVKAQPRAGYIFTGWSGASASSEDSLWITMDGNKSLTAKFESVAVSDPGNVVRGTFIDERDGKEYATVGGIGTQMWMAENMNIEMGNSWCYDNNEANCGKYGRLYDWETAAAVCPTGWHLPDNVELRRLEAASGGIVGAGGKLKAVSGWSNNGNGTDDYGFSALPGGRRGLDNIFSLAGDDGFWWIATAIDDDLAHTRYMVYNSDGVMDGGYEKGYGFSVRCLSNVAVRPPPPTSSFTDERNGRMYKTVVIGNQTWMAENLNYQVDFSWCYDGDIDNCNKYGRLYQWAAAMDLDASYNNSVWGNDVKQQGVCPNGWHIPSRREWGDLFIFAGGTGEYGEQNKDHVGDKLRSVSGWPYSEYNIPTDDFGFSALPGGYRYNSFREINDNGYWWVATEVVGGGTIYGGGGNAYNVNLNYNGVYWDPNPNGGRFREKTSGFSIRCIKD